MAHKTGEPHIRLFRDLLDSEAYRSLPDPAVRLLVDLRAMLTSANNGMLKVTLSALRRRGWNSNDKLTRALARLLDRGILVRTKRCGPNVRAEASRYAFTDLHIVAQAVHGIAGKTPTYDYRKWPRGENSDIRQTVKRYTARRIAALPPDGEQPLIAIPPDGKRGNGPLSLSANANPPNSPKQGSSPPHGQTLQGKAIPTTADAAPADAASAACGPSLSHETGPRSARGPGAGKNGPGEPETATSASASASTSTSTSGTSTSTSTSGTSTSADTSGGKRARPNEFERSRLKWERRAAAKRARAAARRPP